MVKATHSWQTIGRIFVGCILYWHLHLFPADDACPDIIALMYTTRLADLLTTDRTVGTTIDDTTKGGQAATTDSILLHTWPQTAEFTDLAKLGFQETVTWTHKQQ